MTEFEKEWQEKRKAMLTVLEVFITERYGEKCPDYEPLCTCCEMWKLFERIAYITE